MIWLELCGLFFIYGVVAYFRFFSERSLYDQNHNSLYLNKAYFWIGLIGTTVCFFAGIIIWIIESIWLSFVFFALALVFAFILSGYYGNRLWYDDEKILYRKYFEKYKIIYYKDITTLRCDYDIEIETKEKRLIVPSYMVNYGAFLDVLVNNTSPKSRLKIRPESKTRKFRDSVYRVGEFVFSYVLMYVLMAGYLLIWLVCDKDRSILEPENTFALCAVIFMTVIGCAFPIISIISAKRAHSSNFWKTVAKYCFREGYLKK